MTFHPPDEEAVGMVTRGAGCGWRSSWRWLALLMMLAAGVVPVRAENLRGEAAMQQCRKIVEEGLGGREAVLSSDDGSAVSDFALSLLSDEERFETLRLGGQLLFVIRMGPRDLPVVVSGNDWAFAVSRDHPGALHYLGGSIASAVCSMGWFGKSRMEFKFLGLKDDPEFPGEMRADFLWFAGPWNAGEEKMEAEAAVHAGKADVTFSSPRGVIRVLLDKALSFPISDGAMMSADREPTRFRIDSGAAVSGAWRDVTPEKIAGAGCPLVSLQGSAIQWLKRSSSGDSGEAASPGGESGTEVMMKMMQPLMRALDEARNDSAEWPAGMLAAAEALSACLPPPQPMRIEKPAAPVAALETGRENRPHPVERDTVIPLDFISVPVVRVSIEGQGEHWFLVDTGASDSTMSSRLADQLPDQSVTSGGGVIDARGRDSGLKTVKVPSLSLGEWKIGEYEFAVVDLPSWNAVPVSGVIGCDLLGVQPFTIDAEAARLTLYRRDGFRQPEGGDEVPLMVRDGRPWVQVTMEGLGSFDALLDTGLTNDFGIQGNMSEDAEKALSVLPSFRSWMAAQTGMIRGRTVRWPASRECVIGGRLVERELLICRTPFRDERAPVPVLVGFPLIRRDRLTFDLAAGRLWVVPAVRRTVAERMADGWKPDVPDLGGDTALTRAIAGGDRVLAETLMEAGAAFKVPGGRQHPVEAAVSRGDLAMVQWVAGKDATGTWKNSGALGLSIFLGLPDVAAWFLGHQGISAEAMQGAMLKAAEVGDIESAALLRRSGIGFTVPVDEAATLADEVQKHPLSRAVSANQPEFLRWVAQADPEALRKTLAGHSLLTWSLYAGHDECTRVLLAAGLDPAAEEARGLRPVQEAVISGRHEILRELLPRPGVDGLVMEDGATLLMLAAQWGYAECVEQILERKPDIGRRQKAGFTALHFAARGMSEKYRPVPPEAEFRASVLPERDYARCFLALLKAGADPFVRAEAPVFLNACEVVAATAWGRVDLVSACFRGSVVPDRAPHALGFAAECGNEPVLRYLLEKGYDPAARNPRGATPVFISCAEGKTGCVLRLLEKGADVQLRNANGMQALHVAARHNDAMLIRALIQAGADPDAEDDDGNVPLCHAIEFRALASVRALLAAGASPRAGSGSFSPQERAGHLLPAYPAINAAIDAAVAAAAEGESGEQ